MRPVLFLLIALSCALQAARADNVILIGVSYKVIRNPEDGATPPFFSDAAVDQSISEMNSLLLTYGRGYQFIRVDPVIRVGAMGGFDRPNPSHYYGINMLDDPNQRLVMEGDALANPAQYAWNFSAINIYINEANTGGICSFPNSQILIIGDSSTGSGTLQLHEIGHYFDLCHTQGCPCGCCDPNLTGQCHTTPGNDEMADTLPDLACWNRDDIAQHNFGVNYAALTPAQQFDVDNVFLNIMSYHASGCGSGFVTSRLTENQLDRWSDTASFTRTAVRDGRTFFVQAGAGGSQNGRSTNPFDLVAEGLAAASGGGDIVLIRDGVYPENQTISAPVTLRTPRGHVVRIGTP